MNGCGVKGSFGAETQIVLSALFEVLVDTADGELMIEHDGRNAINKPR